MAMAVKISRDLATVTSCIDVSVRIVTKPPKVGPQLIFSISLVTMHRVGNFRQKNNSVEDGIDGTHGYFRLNSGCSAEQKTLGIPFRTLLRKRNNSEFRSMEQKKKHTLGIPF
jgi:hypothetical protein